MEDGSSFVQRVVYDWRPPQCKECNTFGHVKTQCPKAQKVKQIWRAKEKSVDQGAALENNSMEQRTKPTIETINNDVTGNKFSVLAEI